uniref:Uncharacterized protein n=1 Tax=Rhizophora mucronata TaxID=61149 RepID=A0A2P2P4R3_RHIMU
MLQFADYHKLVSSKFCGKQHQSLEISQHYLKESNQLEHLHVSPCLCLLCESLTFDHTSKFFHHASCLHNYQNPFLSQSIGHLATTALAGCQTCQL